MTISTAPRVTPAQARSVTLTLAAKNSLGQLQEHTGLSQDYLANCAITWYAFFDAQLRAGYTLTLRGEETGKAYTLSLAGAWTAAASNVCGLLGNGEASSFYFKAGQLSPAQAARARYGPLPSPAAATAQPWLSVTTSRGSPAAAPPRGAAIQCACPVTGIPARQLAVASRNGGSS